MLKKNERTLESYMKAGAEMRLYKTLGAKLWTDCGRLVTADDRKKMMSAFAVIDRVCSNAEDSMFRDYPELTDQYTDVFYGATDIEPRHEVDKQVINLAKETAFGLFAQEEEKKQTE